MHVKISGPLDVAFGEIPAIPSVRFRPVDDVIYEIARFIREEILEVTKQGWDSVVAEVGVDERKRFWM